MAMNMPTTKGAPTTTTNKGTRDAWTIACANAGMDCSFSCTDHNQKELVNFVQTHLKNVHNANKNEKEVLAFARPTKW